METLTWQGAKARYPEGLPDEVKELALIQRLDYAPYFLTVAEICDRFTVLRNGATAGSGAMAGTTRGDLVRMMSGHEEITSGRPAPVAAGKPVLEVRDLPFGRRGSTVSLGVSEGEILGLYGLIGAGRSSFMKMVWGSRATEGGTVSLDGQPLKSGNIQSRIQLGGAYVPEDRRHGW